MALEMLPWASRQVVVMKVLVMQSDALKETSQMMIDDCDS
jgi:hypothetical protein